MVRLVVLIGLILTSSAIAQIDTTCQTIGGITRCRTDDHRSGVDLIPLERNQFNARQVLDSYQQGLAMRRQQEALEAQQRVEMDARNRTYIEQRVGANLAAGNCADAESMALSNGRIDLATQVRDFCAKK